MSRTEKTNELTKHATTGTMGSPDAFMRVHTDVGGWVCMCIHSSGCECGWVWCLEEDAGIHMYI